MWKQFFGDMDDIDFEQAIQLLNAFGTDREKIMETVNMVWDNRERMFDVVNYVSENQARLTDMLEYLGDHREQITDMLDRVPEIMGSTGEGIEAAGVSAVRASALLTGDDPRDDVVSAYELTGMAALALERCNVQLENVATLLQDLGEQIDAVNIPAFQPNFTEVMGFRVVTGVDITESALSDNAAARFSSGADQISEVGDDFSVAALHLRKLGTSLTRTGAKLNSVGGQLQNSGGTLRMMSAGGDFSQLEMTRQSMIDIQLADGHELEIAVEAKMEAEIAELQATAAATRKKRQAAAKKTKVKKKSVTKAKPASKKTAAKQAPAKKTATKKSRTNKSTAKKSTVKKPTAKKTTAKKSTTKKSTTKKSTSSKSTAKKS